MSKLDFRGVKLEELTKIAAQIFQFGSTYPVWLLEGTMGVGKTTFVKALTSYLGISDNAKSPSFGIVHEYRAEDKMIYHFDCYRLKSEEEAYDIGIEEYLDSGDLCLIEWPEKISGLLPPKFLKIEIFLYNSTQRHFLVSKNG